MVCMIKNKNKFMKQTCLDIWGKHISYFKLSKAANFMKVIFEQRKQRYKYYNRNFIFSLRKRINFKRKKKFKRNFLIPRVLYAFFLFLTKKNFIRYLNKAKRQHGYFIENYLALLEGRLFMVVYRSNFITNIFMIRYIIEQGAFYINDNIKYCFNYIVKIGDYVKLSFDLINLFKNDLLMRLKNRNILWPIPRYLIVNHTFMFVLFYKYPRLKNVAYPVYNIEILLTHHYHHI